MPKPFSVIVPTYKRQDNLDCCLRSLLKQTQPPAEVIIVDDDNLDPEFIQSFQRTFENNAISFTYRKKVHGTEGRGSAESRNIGIFLASFDCIILDDDIELDDGFIEEISNGWERFDSSKLVGIGGKIRNNRKQTLVEKTFNTLFFLKSEKKWDITPVGFQVWDESVDEPERANYVHGGLCAYRRGVLLEMPFLQFQPGRSALEDVDFFMRAKNAGYEFIYDPNAQAIHHASVAGREGVFISGQKETRNRLDIFQRLVPKTIKNRIWFFISMKGWILRQFIAGHFAKGAGMVVGLFKRSI